MRQLRVVGLGDDHETVILEDPIRHERFAVAGDERLRAAARGDVRRLGQMEIEVTSPLRPRDIQARVRAGESVDEVAAHGGVSAAHVERFAYPVLLERARVAEIARRAHPLTPTDPPTPDGRTLGEIVTATFLGRGQDLDDARWDASKAEGGQWVVSLAWQTGRSDNTARWTFRPGSAGGTVEPRDDLARELIGHEPLGGGPRRVAPETASEASSTQAAPSDVEVDGAEQALAVSGDPAPRRGHGTPASTGRSGGYTARRTTAPRRGARPSRPAVLADEPDARAEVTPEPFPEPSPSPSPSPSTEPSSELAPTAVDDQVPEPRSESAPEEPLERPRPAREAGRAGKGGQSGRGRRTHPIVPSWEDVLLGTRSPRA